MTISFRPGTVVASRYRIVEHLGSGGMADVFRAEHLGLGKAVALKILPPARARGGLGDRFDREARAAARLDHPGCVRVLDSGSWVDDSRYIAMELMLGPTLRERMDRIGAFDPVHAAGVASEVLNALAHAHRMQVMHRDLKPANVMFTIRDGREHTVLFDFGLARVQEDPAMTASGTCVGSPSYVAPERLLEQPYDARADLYSVGVLL
jgi:serine/threonine-protein kinase